MKLKNEIFASALDWLVAHQKVDGQKSLAKVLGISENTISRIMTSKVEPSDDTLRKLSEKFGFNMAWLRGSDPSHMFPEDTPLSDHHQVDQSSLINAALAAKDETIAALYEQIKAKDMVIQTKDELIESLRQQLTLLNANTDLRKYPFEIGVAESKESPLAKL
jgi:transcriptional regulator with XRE-family HTH domain